MYQGAFIESESDKVVGIEGNELSVAVKLDDIQQIDPNMFYCWNAEGDLLLCNHTSSSDTVEYTMQREDLTTYTTTTQLFGSPRPPIKY